MTDTANELVEFVIDMGDDDEQPPAIVLVLGDRKYVTGCPADKLWIGLDNAENEGLNAFQQALVTFVTSAMGESDKARIRSDYRRGDMDFKHILHCAKAIQEHYGDIVSARLEAIGLSLEKEQTKKAVRGASPRRTKATYKK